MIQNQDRENHSFDHIIWTVHPMKDNPKKGIVFWIILAIVIWAVYWNIETAFPPAVSIIYTIMAALILLVSLASFYLPTKFTLNENGAEQVRWFYRKKMEWARVRSVVDENTGLFLSPFPVRRRLENYRGMYLYYRGNRDAILAVVRRYKPDLMET